MSKPFMGLGVIIKNEEGKILVGKRTKSHAPYRSIPGGGLELGETFEEGGKREVMEETNLHITMIKVIGITNNLDIYEDEGLHSISIVLFSDNFSGELKNLEPHKCAEWKWVDPKNLPIPYYEACKKGVDNWLAGKFY